MKRILLTALGVILLMTAPVFAGTYFTDAMEAACKRKFGILDNGLDMCRALDDMEDNLNAVTNAADGASSIGVDVTDITGGAYDACTNVSDCLIELGAAGDNDQGAAIIGATTAMTAAFEDCVDLDECLLELVSENTATTGSNLIGFDDGGSQTAAATVANALDQIYGNINEVTIPLHTFRECDADGDVPDAAVGAADGSGGILASDTTPILKGGTTTLDTIALPTIQWAAGNADVICSGVALPANFSGASNVTVTILAAKDDTGSSASGFTVLTNWAVAGTVLAANVSDTTGNLTDATTPENVTATVAAEDVPDAASVLGIAIAPGTHADDAYNLFDVRITYVSE